MSSTSVQESFTRAGAVSKSPTSRSILKTLLEQPGELVTREALRDRLWPANTFVDFEHGLNAAMRRLRDALGDSAEAAQFIETLPRRGYRFVGAIKDALPGEQPDSMSAPLSPPPLPPSAPKHSAIDLIEASYLASQAAAEAQSARVYAGIRVREGCVAGSRQGTQIARFVAQHSLRPLKAKH